MDKSTQIEDLRPFCSTLLFGETVKPSCNANLLTYLAMPSKQSASPSHLLTVEIPTGLEATMSTGIQGPGGPLSRESATEADIKFGERTAFIPMTCQEQQILDRLEVGLQSAASLWAESQQQQEHDRLLSSALHHWRAATSTPGIDTSWVWEVGRWNTQYSLPFALELRRLDPGAMAESDQLLALSTCLRNRQIELAKKLALQQQQASATSPGSSCGGGGGKSGGSYGKKKTRSPQHPPAKQPPQPPSSLEDLDDEPCLCQIRWGLAPDTEAAKRRQLEKLDEIEQSTPTAAPQKRLHQNAHPHQNQLQPQPLQQPHHHQHQLPRPIVKTSHLRGGQAALVEAAAASVVQAEDAGYSSQSCSPGSRAGGSFINDLLAASAFGGRNWAD